MSGEETISILADPVEKIACRKCNAHLDVSRLPSFSSVVCPQCGLKQMVPALLGQFLLLELLGAGGMGAVYKALDQALGRYVAIKVMKQAMGNDPQFVENFLREARAAAAINHRNVVQIYSCGQEKGQPYIVMELVSGGRLDEQIGRGDPLDETRVLEIGVGVAEGLKAAHDIGLIHGDIKPANILFDKDHTPKVADFGLARFIAWQQNRGGEVWGTPYYIAPEKARGQKEDHRSDIYSLGATLYHALGAKPPFDGQTATDVVLARLKNPAVSIRVVRPALQPETADVIGRMLEADPFMRYPTYPSLLTDLREAHRVAKLESGGHHRKEKKSSLAPVLGLVGGLLLLIIVLAVILVRVIKKPEEKPPAPVLPPTMRVGTPRTPTPATGTTAVVKPPDSGSTAVAAGPFPREMESAILAAMRQVTGGQADALRLQAKRLQTGLDTAGATVAWLQLLDAVGALASGNEAEAKPLLEALRSPLQAVAPEGADQGVLARTLASLLLNEATEDSVRKETAKWPPAYNDLAKLFSGLAALRRLDLVGAEAGFNAYAGATSSEPAWPYGLQAAARAWKEQVSGFRFQKESADEWMKHGQGAKARSTWEEFLRKTSPLFYPYVDAEVARARESEAQDAASRQAAEEKVRAEKIQADLDRLDAVRGANGPIVAQKDYRKALQNLLQAGPALQTPEGQKTLANIREIYERMDELKKFLMTRINAAPFPGAGTELGGTTIAADTTGIRVALGSHGELVRTWPEISVRMYMQMLGHYLSAPDVKEADRANLTLSIAVYCYENGGFRAAANYADQAVKLNPELKAKARSLMPDILPE
ncbi:MAG: serine/threonine protein kinase [Kiritimatiellae bacterium]|nr:serine/threonine protein kinase [Kiritimatiellia bacterium]